MPPWNLEYLVFDIFNHAKHIFWETTEKVASSLGELCKSLASTLATYLLSQSSYFQNGILNARVTVVDLTTILIENIELDVEEFLPSSLVESIPFTVRHAYIKEARLHWIDADNHQQSRYGRLHVVVNRIELVIDVSEQRFLREKDTFETRDTTIPFVDHIEENEHLESTGTPIIKDLEDAKKIVEDLIDDTLRFTQVSLNDIRLFTVSGLTLGNSIKHTMNVRISNINNVRRSHSLHSFLKWEVNDAVGYICQNVPAVNIPRFLMMVEDGRICADFNETDNIHVALCGDAGFIFSTFVQQIVENLRILNRKNVLRKHGTSTPINHDLVAKEVTRSLEETMTKSTDNACMTEVTKMTSGTIKTTRMFPEITGFQLRDLQFTLDIFKGSDLHNTRERTERFTVKLWGGYMEYDPIRERLLSSIRKIQTTVGYIDDPLTLKMRNVGGYWDADLKVPEIYVRTSQHIVDKIIILFNFNVQWNEYYMIYNVEDSVRFRHVYISDIEMRFIYYNSPMDYKKVLKGNWKNLVRFIPHCDINLTFPNTIIKYVSGWEDLVDAYLKEMFTNQKLRCVKKVIVGTAKRKLKKIVGMGNSG